MSDARTCKNYETDGGDTSVVGGELRFAALAKQTADGTQAGTIPMLTGTLGTADDALVAVPLPAATPADATALRNDIATTLVPVINADLADLQAKVNGMLAALRGVGILPTP